MNTRPTSSRTAWRAGRRLAGAVVLVAAMSLGVTACASSASSSDGTLVLYSAQHEQTTDAMIRAFEKQTGIQVKVDNDDEDVLTAQIEQEGTQSPADVVYTENSNWLQRLDGKGLLAKADATTVTSVPAGDSSRDGTWVGVSARVAAMVYNPKVLTASQLPTSILQLADPQWKGKIEIAPSETDFWPVVASVYRSYGRAKTISWLEGVKANAGTNDNVPDNETLTSDVSQGQADLALINHYYYYRLQAEVGKGSVNAKLAYLAPKDAGYVEGISGAAVLKSSDHPAAAQKFLQFLTSAEGQTVLAQGESYEYPIRPGVAANSVMPPLSSLHPTDFTPADLNTGSIAQSLLTQAGLL